jgi:hypothetical protein
MKESPTFGKRCSASAFDCQFGFVGVFEPLTVANYVFLAQIRRTMSRSYITRMTKQVSGEYCVILFPVKTDENNVAPQQELLHGSGLFQ